MATRVSQAPSWPQFVCWALCGASLACVVLAAFTFGPLAIVPAGGFAGLALLLGGANVSAVGAASGPGVLAFVIGWLNRDGPGEVCTTSGYFWGLRLHLLCTLGGLPVGFALSGAKADERQVLLGILDDPALAPRPGQTLIADKNYYGRDFEATLAAAGIELLRPARKGEPERAGARFFKPLRQVIESINYTFKGQLDLERHGGRTLAGALTRIWQRILALTAAIWHNDRIGAPIKRSLLAYDH